MTKRIAPWVVFGVFIVYLGVAAFAAPARSVSGFDLREFRRLPVSVSGRVQPIDTLARLALLRISGSGSVSVDGSGNQRQAGSLDADEWLLEILAKPDAADARRIFPVDDTVAGKLSLRPGGGTVFYAFRELSGKVEEIGKQTQRIGKLKAGDRAGWETELLRLQSRLVAYERLKNSLQPNSILQREAKGSPIAFDYAQMLGRFRADLLEASRIARRRTDGKADTLDPATEGRIRSFAGAFQAVSRLALVAAIPPHSGEPRSRWSNAGTEIANSARGSALSPAVGYWSKMGSAYTHGDAGAFEAAVSAYRGWLASSGLRREVSRAAWEVFYNGLQPMLRAVPLYILGLILLFAAGADASTGGTPTRRRARPVYESAVLLVALGFALHTTGLVFAFTLAGRPSFLVFAGWTIALCGLLIECFSRRGLGVAVAGIAALTALGAIYALVPGGSAQFVQNLLDVRLLAAIAAAGAALVAAARPFAKQADSPARWVRVTTQA